MFVQDGYREYQYHDKDRNTKLQTASLIQNICLNSNEASFIQNICLNRNDAAVVQNMCLNQNEATPRNLTASSSFFKASSLLAVEGSESWPACSYS